jgi:hypothetical protein
MGRLPTRNSEGPKKRRVLNGFVYDHFPAYWGGDELPYSFKDRFVRALRDPGQLPGLSVEFPNAFARAWGNLMADQQANLFTLHELQMFRIELEKEARKDPAAASLLAQLDVLSGMKELDVRYTPVKGTGMAVTTGHSRTNTYLDYTQAYAKEPLGFSVRGDVLRSLKMGITTIEGHLLVGADGTVERVLLCPLEGDPAMEGAISPETLAPGVVEELSAGLEAVPFVPAELNGVAYASLRNFRVVVERKDALVSSGGNVETFSVKVLLEDVVPLAISMAPEGRHPWDKLKKELAFWNLNGFQPLHGLGAAGNP